MSWRRNSVTCSLRVQQQQKKVRFKKTLVSFPCLTTLHFLNHPDSMPHIYNIKPFTYKIYNLVNP